MGSDRAASESSDASKEGMAWDRRFQVWSYSVSHRLLLLWSTKSAEHPSQVDVLFEDVRAMELATTLLALRIDAVDCSGFPTVTGVGRDGAKCTNRALHQHQQAPDHSADDWSDHPASGNLPVPMRQYRQDNTTFGEQGSVAGQSVGIKPGTSVVTSPA